MLFCCGIQLTPQEIALHPPCLQPLSLRNYPYDDSTLETQLTLTDTSRSVAGHPGLQLVPSAASLKVC